MPENVSFAQIPVDIRTPGQFIEIDNGMAVQGLPNQPRKLLILGQRLAAGTVAAEVPTRIFSASQAIGQFGRGSQLARMIVAAKRANPYADMRAIALDDNAAGVAATGTLTFSGTVAAAGTLNLYIDGVQVQAGVAAGEAAATTATNVAARINANADLPVTATAATAAVTFTARNKGECGNNIDVRLNYYAGEALLKGLLVAIVAMNGGTGNPAIADAIAAMASDQYSSIVMPWTDAANVTAMELELSDRWGPMSQRTGHIFGALAMAQGAAATYGSARNSPHDSFMVAYKSPTSPEIWAATLAAVCESSGSIDPARPFQTLPLPGVLPPAEVDRFTQTDRNLLLRDGISTFTVDAGGQVLIERVVTTYQVNAFGIDDISYLDLETKWTVDYIRYAVRARIALRYPRHKLTDDENEIKPGQAMVRAKDIRSVLIELFRELQDAGLVENIDQYKKDLLVVRSKADPNRVNAIIPPDVVNQFRVFAAAVQFRL